MNTPTYIEDHSNQIPALLYVDTFEEEEPVDIEVRSEMDTYLKELGVLE